MPPPRRAAKRVGIDYRPMTDADLDFVEALYAASRADELAVTGWPDEQKRAFLSHQHRAQHHHYRTYYPNAEWLIVERGGARIGRLYLVEWADQFRVIDIAIAEGSQGRGFGTAILEDVMESARSKGKGVSIHVEKNNPARRLYDRLGFVRAEDKGVYDLMEWGPPPR
jgi:ribosomal protein S18 acetylase RimI-like enzyme